MTSKALTIGRIGSPGALLCMRLEPSSPEAIEADKAISGGLWSFIISYLVSEAFLKVAYLSMSMYSRSMLSRFAVLSCLLAPH